MIVKQKYRPEHMIMSKEMYELLREDMEETYGEIDLVGEE